MPNEKIVNRENLKAFRRALDNRYAKPNGNYPTMTVGVADQLSPYDDESGDDQDEPFNFQATGTGNGSQPDFSTGEYALMKEKQGNSVVVNQQVRNYNFNDGTNYFQVAGASASVSNNVFYYTVTNVYNDVYSNTLQSSSVTPIVGHKYLISACVKLPRTPSPNTFNLYVGGGYLFFTPTANVRTFCLGIVTATNNNRAQVHFACYESDGWQVGDVATVEQFICIDLTQWFNGDIPQDLLDNPSNFYRYYQGSLAYNAGELVNANGRYIKCIGRQQWDEVWEVGGINANGNNESSTTNIRSKNYIKVIPNTTYYFRVNGSGLIGGRFYDVNQRFIGSLTINSNNTFVVPSNAFYMRFVLLAWYGTTYNHDITVSLYYEGESGYDQYYPYELLSNVDTGTETLRSAGSVKDYKTPDGTIHRLVGSVDLSQLTWESLVNNAYVCSNIGIKPSANNGVAIIAVSNKYPVVSYNTLASDTTTNQLSGYISDRIYVRDTSGSPTGTLYFELATSTTEQGTTFSPNLIIDDFGSMDFSGTNGVPQGNLILYPVDYKAFIDTLYNYTEGTASNIALKSDLPTAPQSWAESLPGYDATKTQTLKNVEGTLTWVNDE